MICSEKLRVSVTRTTAQQARPVAWGLLLLSSCINSTCAQQLQPLTTLQSAEPTGAMVELGRALFFDPRLSGDATISCATCHDPGKQFTDQLPLSRGYPGTLYFRNTPTLINASLQSIYYWDGRMSGDDLPSLVRDHISEAHFMQADGRLVLERLRQVPQYQRQFREAAGGEPSYGRVLNAVAAFVQTLRCDNAPLDRYLAGDETAMPEQAVKGMQLFEGKAKCSQCHNGALLSDGEMHATGVPTNRDVFANPERHITFRRFMRTIGVGNCASLRVDIGFGCVTKSNSDTGKFRTPSLRQVDQTSPYMHDGSLASLTAVIEFYDQGGGPSENKSSLIEPLNLSDEEKQQLEAFLKQLSGEPIKIEPVAPPEYQIREIGEF